MTLSEDVEQDSWRAQPFLDAPRTVSSIPARNLSRTRLGNHDDVSPCSTAASDAAPTTEPRNSGNTTAARADGVPMMLIAATITDMASYDMHVFIVAAATDVSVAAVFLVVFFSEAARRNASTQTVIDASRKPVA